MEPSTNPEPTTGAPVFDGQPVINFANQDAQRRFMRTAAIVGVGSTLVAASRSDPRALADDKTDDLEILNYALTLEYLEAEFYTLAITEGVVKGRELELITPIRDHEKAHVDAVTQTIKDIGGKPVEKPEFQFPDGTFTNRKKFLTSAAAFEELGVTAYHGQVPRVKDGDILAAAAAIAGVESRHAAVVADLLGENPFPAPFEKTMSMDEVLKAAEPFVKS